MDKEEREKLIQELMDKTGIDKEFAGKLHDFYMGNKDKLIMPKNVSKFNPEKGNKEQTIVVKAPGPVTNVINKFFALSNKKLDAALKDAEANKPYRMSQLKKFNDANWEIETNTNLSPAERALAKRRIKAGYKDGIKRLDEISGGSPTAIKKQYRKGWVKTTTRLAGIFGIPASSIVAIIEAEKGENPKTNNKGNNKSTGMGQYF